MDNQQPSPEQGKVQRLSHRGVLDYSEIIWETPPCNSSVIYVYKLMGKKEGIIRYIGITQNPKTRLSHHLNRKCNPFKRGWTDKIITSGDIVQMIIFDYSDNLEDALIKEEQYIEQYYSENLTNAVYFPTQPNTKKVYCLDIYTGERKEFISRNSFGYSLGISPTFRMNSLVLGRFLISYTEDFESLIENRATLKIKKDNDIQYFLNYKHLCSFLSCSASAVQSVLCGRVHSIKGWQVVKKENNFGVLKGRYKRKIKCITTGKTYDSIKQAAFDLNLDPSCITKSCKGNNTHIKNYRFEYITDDIV